MGATLQHQRSARTRITAAFDRRGPILGRLYEWGHAFTLVVVWVLVGFAVTTGTTFYRGTGSLDYGSEVPAVAQVGDCTREGPVSDGRLGFWWRCQAAVQVSDGRAVSIVLDGSKVTRNLLQQTQLKSGSMTAAEKAAGFPRSTLLTHTENRAMRLPTITRGTFVVIEGQYAPCPSCRNEMRKTAVARNATIAYRWEGRAWVAAPYGAGANYRLMIERLTRHRK